MSDTLREALKKDFNELLVKEFTTDWSIQRLKIGLDIDVMSFDNIIAYFQAQQDKAVLEAQFKELTNLGKRYNGSKKAWCDYYEERYNYLSKEVKENK